MQEQGAGCRVPTHAPVPDPGWKSGAPPEADDLVKGLVAGLRVWDVALRFEVE